MAAMAAADTAVEGTAATTVAAATEAAAAIKAMATTKGAGASEGVVATSVAWRLTGSLRREYVCFFFTNSFPT